MQQARVTILQAITDWRCARRHQLSTARMCNKSDHSQVHPGCWGLAFNVDVRHCSGRREVQVLVGSLFDLPKNLSKREESTGQHSLPTFS